MKRERRMTSIGDAGRRFRRRSEATADVLAYLAAEPARGRLLELPCGDGQTTQKILDLGYEVVPADLSPEHYRLGEPKCVKVDMTDSFPFEDASFDYVLCQAGIEHIQSPLTLTRECGRVLRTGGKLMLTTPNVLYMSARLAYFLVGQRTVRRGLIGEHCTLSDRVGDELSHGHAWHWRYHVLRYILRLSGFKVYKPLCGKYSWFSILLSIPLYPILWLAHRHAVESHLERESRRRPELVPLARESYKEIVDHSLSRAVLWGTKMILVAEKESPTFLESDPYWSKKGQPTH